MPDKRWVLSYFIIQGQDHNRGYLSEGMGISYLYENDLQLQQFPKQQVLVEEQAHTHTHTGKWINVEL